MQSRFHRALIESSELAALFVLVVLLVIRAWRKLQFAYHRSPGILELLECCRRWVNVKISYIVYDQYHWIGVPLSQRERAG